MAYKTLPFLTRKELQSIIESCERTEDGCLIWTPRNNSPNLISIHGGLWCVQRLMWSEFNVHTLDLRHKLDTHEVIHIAECPNTGYGKPLCIEPTHLTLGDQVNRNRYANERRKA